LRHTQATLEKENRKLRQSLDVKETSLDEAMTRQSSLEQENKTLKKSLEQKKSVEAKNKELEKENKEMFTERNADRKTVATLREVRIQYETIQYNTTQLNTIQCNAMQSNAIQIERETKSCVLTLLLCTALPGCVAEWQGS
jgi:hypothetical protein